MTLLALFATFVFLFSLPGLFINYEKMLRKQVQLKKELDDLKATLDEAKENGNFLEIETAQEAYDQKAAEGCGGCVAGCLMAIIGAGRWITMFVSEIILIVAALSMHVGLPIIGYIALAAWILTAVYNFFIQPKLSAQARAKEEALGNTYIPKNDPIRQTIGFIPDLYALYVVLVIIGLL